MDNPRGAFVPVKGRRFGFSGCAGCEAHCCDGRRGIVFSQIVLEDFEAVYRHFPILFIFGNLGFAKPVILLTNGRDFCPYLEDFRCTIYEERPSICRSYPLSPQIDNQLYIDQDCPAVGDRGAPIVTPEGIAPAFDVPTLQGYQERFLKGHRLFNEECAPHFKPALTLGQSTFFQIASGLEGPIARWHHASLKRLKSDYFRLQGA